MRVFLVQNRGFCLVNRGSGLGAPLFWVFLVQNRGKVKVALPFSVSFPHTHTHNMGYSTGAKDLIALRGPGRPFSFKTTPDRWAPWRFLYRKRGRKRTLRTAVLTGTSIQSFNQKGLGTESQGRKKKNGYIRTPFRHMMQSPMPFHLRASFLGRPDFLPAMWGLPRSSGREVRIRVPTFFCSLFS